MKYLYVTLRVVLAVLLLVPVLGLPYLHAWNLRNLYGVLHEEPYLKISPDVVDPANEGRRVQLTAPAYTDEWLELSDIGVRCQALRLELEDDGYTKERFFMGLPLRSRSCYARHLRLGAFSVHMEGERMSRYMGRQALPWEYLNLPEAWVPHCRVVQDERWEEKYYLNLEFEGETARRMHGSMTANGSVVVVRGVQRGSEIKPVHGLMDDESFFLSTDYYAKERAWWNAGVSQCMLLMLPALFLGIFRLVYWRQAGKSAPLAIWLMLLLEAVAFLCFGGVCDACWTGVTAVVVALSLWQIVLTVRTFGVDGRAE